MALRLILLLSLLLPAQALAGSLPPIIASAGNEVPKCIKPDALMAFVQSTNLRRRTPREIAPRFDHIASLYQRIGRCVSRPPDKCVGVRWDYAFFQMLIETNYLTFRRPDGVPAACRRATTISPASAPRFPAARASISTMWKPACSRICNTS